MPTSTNGIAVLRRLPQLFVYTSNTWSSEVVCLRYLHADLTSMLTWEGQHGTKQLKCFTVIRHLVILHIPIRTFCINYWYVKLGSATVEVARVLCGQISVTSMKHLYCPVPSIINKCSLYEPGDKDSCYCSLISASTSSACWVFSTLYIDREINHKYKQYSSSVIFPCPTPRIPVIMHGEEH